MAERSVEKLEPARLQAAPLFPDCSQLGTRPGAAHGSPNVSRSFRDFILASQRLFYMSHLGSPSHTNLGTAARGAPAANGTGVKRWHKDYH